MESSSKNLAVFAFVCSLFFWVPLFNYFFSAGAIFLSIKAIRAWKKEKGEPGISSAVAVILRVTFVILIILGVINIYKQNAIGYVALITGAISLMGGEILFVMLKIKENADKKHTQRKRTRYLVLSIIALILGLIPPLFGLIRFLMDAGILV